MNQQHEWNVFWCRGCDIPLLADKCPLCGEKTRHISGDRRPVFGTERRMLESILGQPLPTFLFARHNFIFYGEGALLRLTVRDDRLLVAETWLSKLTEASPEVFTEEYRLAQWERSLSANQDALASMEEEAVLFVRATAEAYPHRAKFVSFSGGKDSAVVAVLVNKALGSTPLLFSDTTIEYPPTYDYILQFSEYLEAKLCWQKPNHSFVELCDVLDPPSRIIRWCCTVCKSQPINAFYNTLNCEVLNFDGIRRAESTRRSQYPRVFQVPKYAREVTARPILDWPTFAVWAYVGAHEIPSNPLYDLGFSRVGCMYCPSNRGYNEYLTRLHFPTHFADWHEYLLDYATRTGKPDPESYVNSGHWKARNIRREKHYMVERAQTCFAEQQQVYEFTTPVTGELVEFLRPLGKVSTLTANGKTCFVVGGNNPFLLSGAIGDTRISLTFAVNGSKEELIRSRIERQIEKYLNCVGCGGCVGTCPVGAISIAERRFTVNDRVCTRCGSCTTRSYIERGCIALGYLGSKIAIKKEE